MERKTGVIKNICWIGVAADALWALALVWPQLYGILTGRPLLQADLTLRLSMGVGASLMAGWAILLAWVAKNPIERRAVMLFTALPVIAGLLAVSIIGIVNGAAANVWIVFKCAFLGIAMLWGYHTAANIAKERPNEITA